MSHHIWIFIWVPRGNKTYVSFFFRRQLTEWAISSTWVCSFTGLNSIPLCTWTMVSLPKVNKFKIKAFAIILLQWFYRSKNETNTHTHEFISSASKTVHITLITHLKIHHLLFCSSHNDIDCLKWYEWAPVLTFELFEARINLTVWKEKHIWQTTRCRVHLTEVRSVHFLGLLNKTLETEWVKISDILSIIV